MTEPENLVLVYLRRIDMKIDRVGERVDDLTARMGSVEVNLSNLTGQVAFQHGQYASLAVRLDRVDTQLERINRRLDLTEA